MSIGLTSDGDDDEIFTGVHSVSWQVNSGHHKEKNSARILQNENF